MLIFDLSSCCKQDSVSSICRIIVTTLLAPAAAWVKPRHMGRFVMLLSEQEGILLNQCLCPVAKL